MDVLPCPLGAYHFWRMDDEQFGNLQETGKKKIL
jgi:hypothetical protein